MKKKLVAVLAMGLFMSGMVGMANAAWIQNPTNGHNYDLISAPNNFWQAQNIAQQDYNAHLVTIGDANENQWLVDTFGTNYAWIGFTDEAEEGTWVWITGEPVTYTNWQSGEPNNNGWHGPENYAFINYGAGFWADVANGDHRYPFHAIIEKPSAVPIPGAIWLLSSGIASVVGIRLRRKKK